MSGSFYPGSTPFASADKFLGKKSSRPIMHNTTLERRSADTIAVKYHSTDVVTYHRDETQVIWLNGWNTPTTKRRLREFAATSVSNHKGQMIVGWSGERTPSKVQKCRTCHGTKGEFRPDYCRPGGWNGSCPGPQSVYDVPIGEPGWWESRRVEPCEHDMDVRHSKTLCEHDSRVDHVTGKTWHDCYRCSGTGQVDYGNKEVPILLSTMDAFRVDAYGKFLGECERPSGWGAIFYPDGPPTPKKKKSAPEPDLEPWEQELIGSGYATSKPGHEYGGEIVATIAQVIPAMREQVKHPVTGGYSSLNVVIVDLNDSHRWSRERIADWLDTLDLDLAFPAAS
jgi:hypothetical protein